MPWPFLCCYSPRVLFWMILVIFFSRTHKCNQHGWIYIGTSITHNAKDTFGSSVCVCAGLCVFAVRRIAKGYIRIINIDELIRSIIYYWIPVMYKMGNGRKMLGRFEYCMLSMRFWLVWICADRCMYTDAFVGITNQVFAHKDGAVHIRMCYIYIYCLCSKRLTSQAFCFEWVLIEDHLSALLSLIIELYLPSVGTKSMKRHVILG